MWSSSFISQFAVMNYKFGTSLFILIFSSRIIYLFKTISKLIYKNMLYTIYCDLFIK